MPKWTRRELLKAGLAASTGAVAASGLTHPASAKGKTAAEGHLKALHRGSEAPIPAPEAEGSPRERLLMDFGWRFHLGHAHDSSRDFGFGAMDRELTFAKSGEFPQVTHADFDDRDWSNVDLPHDWAIDLPFVNAPNLPEHGGKPLGRDFPATSIGWYRRVFTLPPSDAGKRLTLEFDGVFRHAMVMFNGHYLGESFSGYAPFQFDLTDLANPGAKNVLAVRVDATIGEGWFYEGAGIYRHVWLVRTGPLHIAHWGNVVRCEVQGDRARVLLSSELENESDLERTCRCRWRIVDATGKQVATAESGPAALSARGTRTFESEATVSSPALWSPDEPNLYRALVTVESNGQVVDTEETEFGIRTVRFDADRGFFLNDKPVKIKGTCNHQDHAGVGAALPDALQYFRIKRLKEMGSNAYRTSHNPPTPELLTACDRLGMLVMDETRMMASSSEGLSQLERMVRRDRNHPCIVIWSCGNEEPEQGTARGARMVAAMKRLVRKLDPTRPITVAMNGGWGAGGVSDVVDVQGFNYYEGQIDNFHARFPGKPVFGSETASHYFTRGIYEDDPVHGYLSAYDVNAPSYAKTAEQWWKFYDARPFLAGGFAWTGFDYRGEPSPYQWPCISSHFGIMDTCGFPKDTYFYYQAWWGTEPVLHLFPHWNWEGREGREIWVWCHTNLESVELFLNGKSLGTQRVEGNSHVEWKVKYAPGVIEARGSKNGRIVLTSKRETAGPPARIALRPDRNKIAGNGEDVAVVTAEIVDREGRIVPTASNPVSFEIAGSGKVIGVGNGDPSCHEPDRGTKRSAFNGLCMAIVQARKQNGEITVRASGAGLESASLTIEAESARPRPAVE